MAPTLSFSHLTRKVVSDHAAEDILAGHKSFEAVSTEAEQRLGVHPGTYDFYDIYGKVEVIDDIQRALKLCGEGSCNLEMRERFQFMKIRVLEENNAALTERVAALEQGLKQQDVRTDERIEAAKRELKQIISRVNSKLVDDVVPTVEELQRDTTKLKKEMRITQEKLGSIDIQALKDMMEKARVLSEQMGYAIKKVGDLDADVQQTKETLKSEIERTNQEIKDLQRYIQGKLDVMLEADADLRRELQLLSERLSLAQDDHKLLQENLKKLEARCMGALEESEQLRDLMGQVREDNDHARHDNHMVSTRVHCLEGEASDKWKGFAPGVLYFRNWHHLAKGPDVQLSASLITATGRGNMAHSGVVMGTTEGLVVASGPCRRFGTPGQFSSYYEVEIEEIRSAPPGAGGMYLGFSLQSAEEILAHPKNEFDGWLLGGHLKALICRRSDFTPVETEAPADQKEWEKKVIHKVQGKAIEDTFAVAITSHGPDEYTVDACKMLRSCFPARAKGEVKEVVGFWSSEDLTVCDRIGVLFRCNRGGGAVMRISVNGTIMAEHKFMDAPPAEAIGFLTPALRIAGTGKSVKIMPGLSPPTKMLADH
eukprot:TRINITY_DN37062_c1_g1_i1.p1 TRINITY_DN37062_c1_g1~~TRINITY_DN37062_c1_g1_i1.p1  ORF type:complete len:629 (+),score=153.88 TRINITY_DN37062_c1_g1_i1:98-1888(+)